MTKTKMSKLTKVEVDVEALVVTQQKKGSKKTVTELEQDLNQT